MRIGLKQWSVIAIVLGAMAGEARSQAALSTEPSFIVASKGPFPTLREFDAETRELIRRTDRRALIGANPGFTFFDREFNRVYSVNDLTEGPLRVYTPDGGLLRVGKDLDVGVGIRDVAHDDSRLVVLSRETTDKWGSASARLRIFRRESAELEREIPLVGISIPWAPADEIYSSRRLAIGGWYAYIAVDRQRILPINLTTGNPSPFFSLARASDAAIVDMRVVGQTLFVLYRSSNERGAVHWVDTETFETGYLELAGEAETLVEGSFPDGRPAVFLLESGRNQIEVVDVERRVFAEPIAVPTGASELAASDRFSLLVLLYSGEKRMANNGGGAEGQIRFVTFENDAWSFNEETRVTLRRRAQQRLTLLPLAEGELILALNSTGCVTVPLDELGRAVVDTENGGPMVRYHSVGGQPMDLFVSPGTVSERP